MIKSLKIQATHLLTFVGIVLLSFLFVSSASAMTVSGGTLNKTLSTTSGSLTLNPIRVTCDFNNEITGTVQLRFDYTSTAGGSDAPFEFDLSNAGIITVVNNGTVNVSSATSFADGTVLEFPVFESCMTADYIDINNVELKAKDGVSGSEGTGKMVARTSAGSIISNNSFAADTLLPKLTTGKVIDEGGVGVGKPTHLSLEFSEDVTYSSAEFDAGHWLVTPSLSPGFTNIGDLTLGPEKSAGLNKLVLTATPTSQDIATFGIWTISPTGTSLVKDLAGNTVAQTAITVLDEIEPVVKSVTPSVNGIGIRNGKITVVFSEAMATATVSASLNPAVNVTTEWSSNFETLTINPTGQSYSTAYTVTITGSSLNGAEALATNVKAPALANSWSYSIEDEPGANVPSISSLSINGGSADTFSADVSVTFDSTNADQYQFGSNPALDHRSALADISAGATYSYMLSPGPAGTRQVCGQVKKTATAEISSTVCDSIVLKAGGAGVPTNPAISINNGAQSTDSLNVTLSLSATNATKMALSSNSSFTGSEWEDYSSTKLWPLLSGEGEKMVWVMYASNTGAVTVPTSATITYTAPSGAQPSSPFKKDPPKTPTVKKALPTGITAGMLVKRHDNPAVYYVGADGYRYVFPHFKVFLTWYSETDLKLTSEGGKVTTIAPTTLAAMPLGGNVTYRPGVKMIKIQTDDRVYAVSRGGILRWVKSEQVAIALYGPKWNTMIDDVNPAFFINYGVGNDIAGVDDFNPDNAKFIAPTIEKDKDLSAD